MGYYVHTYTQAREHGWDLSGTTWRSQPQRSQGPDSNLDKIFSPEFLYNQANWGEDKGSDIDIIASILIRLGCATWSTMPWDDNGYTEWPSETAWRDAARYRGREVGTHYWDYMQNGYFVLYDDSDINLLKSLLASGYCVSTSINADTETGLFSILSSQDVASVVPPDIQTNHAQTIVGYKESTEWDPANPDS
jgi:hypothetical protein